jgi:hypothetical protein
MLLHHVSKQDGFRRKNGTGVLVEAVLVWSYTRVEVPVLVKDVMP